MFSILSILNRNLNSIHRSKREFNHLCKLKLNKLSTSKKTNSYQFRFNSSKNIYNYNSRKKDVALYGLTLVLISFALTYASVPIYRVYCQVTGKGGKPKISDDFLANKVKRMKKNKEKLLNVSFIADKEATMRWNFKPAQEEIKIYPGETALAFFTAKNPTNKPVNGVSTYSVAPVEAGKYLNKIQCFCFEEQRLDPGEEVDLPVFFYFDPEFATDPRLENVEQVALSYTFFEAKQGFKLPTLPNIFSKE